MSASGDRGADAAGPVLRVVSYNLRDLRDDVGAAVRVVRALDPDVLLVQEVPRQRVLHHRIRAFARAAGLRWPGGSRGSGGTSVLTGHRVTAVSTRHHRLPVPFLQRERGWAEAWVRVGADPRPVHVVSLHLGLSPEQRLDHARRVLAALARGPGAGTRVVIGGDLNEGEDGAAWRLLAAGRTRVGPTGPTFPSVRPHRCIDAIFATADLAPVPADAGAAGDPAEADLRAATDHRPVRADLRVR